MDFLDIIFEIIVDGSVKLSESKKAPMPLRVLACLVCLAFLGIVVSIIYISSYDALIEDNTATAITFYVIGSFIVIILSYMIYRQFKELNKKRCSLSLNRYAR